MAPAGHVTSSKLAPPGAPQGGQTRAATVEPRGRSRPLLWGPSYAGARWADMEGYGVGGLVPGLGPELLSSTRSSCAWPRSSWRTAPQAQLHMRLWQEEQLWLQQLQEQQAWVRVEGLELGPWPWSSSAARP